MNSSKEEYVEFRYYEIPMGRYDLALLGQDWVVEYGTDPFHFHNFLEIGYCYYGDGAMCFGDEEKEYHSGSISIIPGKFPHRTQGPEGVIQKWEYLFVDIEGILKKFYPANQVFRERFVKNVLRLPYLVNEKAYPGLAMVIRAILDENRDQKPHFREAVNGYLMVLIWEIARLGGQELPENDLYESQVDKIRAALEYIETHFAEEIKIRNLAELCHVSESYFRKIFVRCMNVPPLEYVNLIRIQNACELMLKGSDSMETLAWKVGFSSLSAFMRNFKKIVGEPPKQWRTRHGRKNEYVNYHTNVRKGW